MSLIYLSILPPGGKIIHIINKVFRFKPKKCSSYHTSKKQRLSSVPPYKISFKPRFLTQENSH